MALRKTLTERREKDLRKTLLQLAHESGIDYSLLWRYEHGQYRPYRNLAKVADAYRMTFEEVLSAVEAARSANHGEAS